MADATFCRKCGARRLECDRCICGDFFLPDACFCRKCGGKRPEARFASTTTLQQPVASFAAPCQPAASMPNASLTRSPNSEPTTRAASPGPAISATLDDRRQDAGDTLQAVNSDRTGGDKNWKVLTSEACGATAAAAEKELLRRQQETAIGPQVRQQKPLHHSASNASLATWPACSSATASLPLTSPSSLSSTAATRSGATEDLAEKIHHTKMAVEALETFMSPAP